MEENKTTINERIKLLRKSHKMTQKDFCTKTGISRSLLATIENGTTEPSPKIAQAIIDNLYVNEKWLFEGVGPVFKDMTSTERLALKCAELLRSDDNVKKQFIYTLLDMSDDFWLKFKENIETNLK